MRRAGQHAVGSARPVRTERTEPAGGEPGRALISGRWIPYGALEALFGRGSPWVFVSLAILAAAGALIYLTLELRQPDAHVDSQASCIKGVYQGTQSGSEGTRSLGSEPPDTFNEQEVTNAPMKSAPGEPADLSFGGFAPGTEVRLTVDSSSVVLGTGVADDSGRIQQNLAMPAAGAGVHTIELEGEAAGGVGITNRVRVRYPGCPVGGDTYATYFCCFEAAEDYPEDEPPEELVAIDYGYLPNYLTLVPDEDGGVFVQIPLFDPQAERFSETLRARSLLTGKTLTEVLTPIPSGSVGKRS